MYKLIYFTLKSDKSKNGEGSSQKNAQTTKSIVSNLNKILLKSIATYHPGVYFLILEDILTISHEVPDNREWNQFINLCFKIMSKILESRPQRVNEINLDFLFEVYNNFLS